MKIALVEWEDARFDNGWICDNSPLHLIRCTTCGVIVREDAKEMEVCLHINEEMKAGRMAIPKSAIRRMRYLKIV